MRQTSFTVEADGVLKAAADIFVYKNRRTMLKGMKNGRRVHNLVPSNVSAEESGGTMAFTMFIGPRKRYVTTFPKRGLILVFFNETDLGAGIVAHELMHVTLHFYPEVVKQYASYKRWCQGQADASEDLAGTIEELTKLFWNWWYDK